MNRRREIVAGKAKSNAGTRTDLLAKLPTGSKINTRAELAKAAQEECLPRFGKIARTGTGQHPRRTSPPTYFRGEK